MALKKIREYGGFAPLKSYFAACRSLDVGFISAVVQLPEYMLQELVGSVFTGFRLYDRPLLMSYFHSGTNWVLYLIEQLTQQPTFRPGQSICGYDYVVDRAHQGYLERLIPRDTAQIPEVPRRSSIAMGIAF